MSDNGAVRDYRITAIRPDAQDIDRRIEGLQIGIQAEV